MVMEARDPEQKATMKMATKARRVGSVFISKSNFIADRERPARRRDDLRAMEM
jgi:hypothetical protein